MRMSWLLTILSVLVTSVGLLFLYAGVAKLLELRSFAQSLLLVPYVPYRFTLPIAAAAAFLEALTGALVVANTQMGKLFAAILLLTFAVIAIVAVARKQKVPCNCFGTDNSEYLSHATVVRNAVLLCIVALAWRWPTYRASGLIITYALIVFVLLLAAIKVRQNHQLIREPIQ